MITLRDYQIEISEKAVHLLQTKKIAYLALEPRCGKTLIALNTAQNYGAKKVLFVTKKKAIKSIENDYRLLNPNYEIVVINYESLHKIIFKPDLVVADEAHCFGSFPKPSNRQKEMKRICVGLPIIFLSGTPSPESYSQLFHQFNISSYTPFIENSFYRWAKEFVNVKQVLRNGMLINDYSNAKIQLIEKYTNQYFIDYTQKESGFNVEIKEKILRVPMTFKQNHLIDTLVKDKCYISEMHGEIIADTAVRLQQLVHQISSGTIKLSETNRVVISDAKAVFIKTYFYGKKIAILYKFIAEREMLKSVFDNWTESPEDFQESTNKTYIGQFVSSREGVNLSTADSIVFMNIDFSYLSYAQGKERIMSKDRIKEAVLYWIFSEGGIEDKIYKSVSKKQDYTSYFFKKDYL